MDIIDILHNNVAVDLFIHYFIAASFMELFLAVLASLFSVVNPLGAVPAFLAMTPHYTPKERSKTILNTCIYFILILIAFYWAGSNILSFYGIKLHSMRIAGGIVILTSGYSLMNGKFEERRGIDKQVKKEALQKEDISFSPMAMPLLSGPGSISLLIGYYSEYDQWKQRIIISGVILALGIVVYIILRISPLLFRVLGVSGLKAITKIMGFFSMAIGVQYIISGIYNSIKNLH